MTARPRPPEWPTRGAFTRTTASPIAASSDLAATRAAEAAAARADVLTRRSRTVPRPRAAASPSPAVAATSPRAARRRSTGSGRTAIVGPAVDELRRRWVAGEPLRQIAAGLGVSVAAVTRARRRLGLELRRRPLDTASVVRLYVEDGLTLEQVAERLGTAPSAVRSRLAAAGVERRPPGRRRDARPDAVRVRALERYAAGDTVSRICVELDIGESTLARWRRDEGLSPRRVGRRRKAEDSAPAS